MSLNKELMSIRSRERIYKFLIVGLLIFTFGIAGISLYFANSALIESKKNIYVYQNSNTLVKAQSTDIANSYEILAKGQIDDFVRLIFQQVPDPENIDNQLKKAYTMSDKSVGNLVDALKNNDYYTNLVNQNYYTRVLTDSIAIDYRTNPQSFKYMGKLKIVRGNQNFYRKIVTTGEIEDMGIRTNENERGFLIRNVKLIDDGVIK